MPLVFAGLAAGATTRLLRNSDAPEALVPGADDYLATLRRGGIALPLAARSEAIWSGVTEAAHSVGGEAALASRAQRARRSLPSVLCT